MRKGMEGQMILHKVDKETIETFLKWVYVREYSVAAYSDPAKALLAHIKLYVFGNRFNIQDLMKQSFTKVTASLVQVNTRVNDVRLAKSNATSVLVAARYAVTNLPSVKEPLVTHIIQHLFCVLPDLCELPEFQKFAVCCPEALVEVCKASTKAAPGDRNFGYPGELWHRCRACGRNGRRFWLPNIQGLMKTVFSDLFIVLFISLLMCGIDYVSKGDKQTTISKAIIVFPSKDPPPITLVAPLLLDPPPTILSSKSCQCPTDAIFVASTEHWRLVDGHHPTC
ncbi:hypothetical protein BDZ91DRAFT_740831 [Kalaharituber pfeilii]|nr:hypothetical protein BDZ91DRAFT_740831 [Kalaharituber pfeilii]